MNSTTLKFNTSAFARAMGGRQDFNKLRDMLTESNYTVNGERLPNGDVCMVVSDINESAFINMADRCQLYEAEDYLLDDIYDDQPDDDLETLMNDCDGEQCGELEDIDSDFAEEDTMTEEYFDPEFEDDAFDDSFLDDTDDFDTVDFDEDFDYRDIDEYDDTLDADYYAAYDIDECIHEALGTKKSRNSRRLNESLADNAITKRVFEKYFAENFDINDQKSLKDFAHAYKNSEYHNAMDIACKMVTDCFGVPVDYWSSDWSEIADAVCLAWDVFVEPYIKLYGSDYEISSLQLFRERWENNASEKDPVDVFKENINKPAIRAKITYDLKNYTNIFKDQVEMILGYCQRDNKDPESIATREVIRQIIDLTIPYGVKRNDTNWAKYVKVIKNTSWLVPLLNEWARAFRQICNNPEKYGFNPKVMPSHSSAHNSLTNVLGKIDESHTWRLNEGLDGYAEMALQDVDPSFVDAGELTDYAIDFFENAKKELEERIDEIEIGDYYVNSRDNDIRLNQYTRQILTDLFGEPEAIAINIIAELTDDMYFENFIADYFGDDLFVFESRRSRNSRRLNEKKKGCCPPKRRSNILRPISEAFTAYKEEDQKKLDKAIASIQDVVKAVKNTTIGAVEVADAFKKLKAQQNAIKKIPRTKDTMFKITDVPGVASVIKKMIAADPDKAKEIKKFRDSLTESVVISLANKKKSLHESVKIDGVAVPNLKNKQLVNMLKEAVETKKKYTKMLGEACGDAEKTNRCKKVINNKNMLITVLAEELSYRKLAAEFKHTIFEADEKEHKEKTTDATELSDEDLATMMGGVDNNPETDKDKADDQEEFDIARIKIRLASKEAAEELKDLCTEAGIPEDAMEIEEGKEEDGADTDKAAEDEDGETEDKDGDTNESIRYSNIRKLFEADEEEADDNTETEGDTKDNAEGAEETDGDEKSEEGEVMFVLTDTDYLEELITVLDDNYGISKEDFQEMTGVDLVEEDSDDSDDDAFDDTEDKDKDDKKDEAEEISAEDVFAGM